jgi:hypothetical protein
MHDTTIANNKINVIKIKGKQDHLSINATMRAQEKYILKGSTSKTLDAPTSQYNIVDQLKKILAQISILKLLKKFPAHKEILEKALMEINVPNDLEVCKFEAMVEHLISLHFLSFSKYDETSHSHPHNIVLHIEV